ncbi:dephospho-CoA kinase [Glaciimonas immobilis]|uniref:Dephospho-CoA kinase n=1 Tax=Glaciimonas immobilis TaxID=728004 RepID=A0A840RUI4_9BURK|nr:dephospho-CoA kinase [Glaciimonas immobilis]KAF3999686.1 dephospho-CoA kinase [Glaciimonas immobilis]MBB5200129.1 dephospho-CoA kinase [Glaciimonas immobilis]
MLKPLPLDVKPAASFRVGLTGGIGSGKTTVTNLFAARGAAIVDTDLIAHALTAKDGAGIAPIQTAFGNEFIAANGAMDRKKMRDHVFSDASAKQRLEAILHPLIRAETALAINRARGLYVMLAIPLLVESGTWPQRLTRILVVDCDEQTQIRRVMERNAMTEPQVRAIMAAQATRQQRLQAATDVITNNSDIEALTPQVERLHAFYQSLIAKS